MAKKQQIKKYKLKNNSIARLNDDGSITTIPIDPENSDYQDYLKWSESGNEPDLEPIEEQTPIADWTQLKTELFKQKNFLKALKKSKADAGLAIALMMAIDNADQKELVETMTEIRNAIPNLKQDAIASFNTAFNELLDGLNFPLGDGLRLV